MKAAIIFVADDQPPMALSNGNEKAYFSCVGGPEAERHALSRKALV